MKRAKGLVRGLAVYLLAGLVTSVVVAWGLAWGVGYSGNHFYGDDWYESRSIHMPSSDDITSLGAGASLTTAS